MKHNILNNQKEVVRNKQKENKTINQEQHLPPCFCNPVIDSGYFISVVGQYHNLLHLLVTSVKNESNQ